MGKQQRTDVEKAHDLLESGEAQLICAYESEEKCNEYKLPWAIPFSEFELKAPTLPKDRRIVFY